MFVRPVRHRSVVVAGWAAFAVIVLGSSRAAYAQLPPTFQMPPEPPALFQIEFGTMSITPGVKLSDIGVDTNVLSLTDTTRRDPDFTATIQPEMMFRLRTSNFDLAATTWAGFVYYHKYADQRAVNPGSLIAFEHRVSSHMTFYGSGAFAFAKNRTGFEVDSRTRHLDQSFTLGSRLRLSKLKFDFQGGYGSTTLDPDARYQGVLLAPRLNRASTAAAVTVSYPLSPYTTVLARTGFTVDRFSKASERDFNSTRGAIGLRFHPRAIIKGEFEVGYAEAKARSDRSPDFSGLTHSGGIGFGVRDTTSVAFGVRRDLDFSFSPTQPYYVYDVYEGSLRQALFHRFDVGLTVAHVMLDYRSFLDGSPATLGTQEDSKMRHLAASFGVVVIKGMRLGVFAARWERLGGTQPYVSDRVGLLMTLGGVGLNERGVFLNGPLR